MGDQMIHPVSLSKRTLNMGHKIPYVDVITDAILSAPNRRLTAKEIFEHVSAKYGPMKKTETLKNTIRHTLSRYKVFRKLQRGLQKKPNWWTVDEHTVFGANQTELGLGLGQPSDLGSISHIIPPPQNQPYSTLPHYLPASNRPVVCFGNGPMPQPPSAFQPPPRMGQICSTDFNQSAIQGIPPGLPYRQPPIGRAGHYVISVEDFAAGALGCAGSTIQPIQPSIAFN